MFTWMCSETSEQHIDLPVLPWKILILWNSVFGWLNINHFLDWRVDWQSTICELACADVNCYLARSSIGITCLKTMITEGNNFENLNHQNKVVSLVSVFHALKIKDKKYQNTPSNSLSSSLHHQTGRCWP